MSEWQNQIYHSENKGDCFAVMRITKGSQLSPIPQLCILRNGEWYPVAKFKSAKRAQEYCKYMEDFLETYTPSEH